MKCMPLRKRAPFNISISGLLHLDDSRTPAVQFICTITHNSSRNYGEKKSHKNTTSLEKKHCIPLEKEGVKTKRSNQLIYFIRVLYQDLHRISCIHMKNEKDYSMTFDSTVSGSSGTSQKKPSCFLTVHLILNLVIFYLV